MEPGKTDVDKSHRWSAYVTLVVIACWPHVFRVVPGKDVVKWIWFLEVQSPMKYQQRSFAISIPIPAGRFEESAVTLFCFVNLLTRGLPPDIAAFPTQIASGDGVIGCNAVGFEADQVAGLSKLRRIL